MCIRDRCTPESFLHDAAQVVEKEFLANAQSPNFNLMALVRGDGRLNTQTPRGEDGGYPLQRTQSGVVAELLAMGFAPDAVEFAVAASGGASTQAALDLLMG
eukprot:TRINITY_DN1263_c0_g1_i2.p2 TRINITY_DN1263_c0_g1~~TRINITY_DN1263_c0_g1_i2.p2  ORF type:complete len:102 (+),score=29.43 TRINITY_DN1263_c0_g1_i2:165-470(+)